MKTNIVLIGIVAFFIIGLIGLWAWGVVIAFQSHVLTGFIILVIEPAPVIVGVFDGIFDAGITEKITNLIEGI